MNSNDTALYRTLRNIVVSQRERKNNPGFAVEFPESIGVKLTNKCNLRCKHCYQWSENGHHQFIDKSKQNTEMDIETFSKIFNESNEAKSRLYLWGGEPLYHSKFDKIIEILRTGNREITIATNGLLIGDYYDGLKDISDNLELLFSIDGFKEQHDSLRGKGVFDKVITNIKNVIEKKKQYQYTYKVTVHSVINNENINSLYQLVEYFENLGVEYLILCYPWFISQDTAYEMDKYYQSNFSWLNNFDENVPRSWYGYNYKLSTVLYEDLLGQVKKIKSKKWKMTIRFQPDLEINQINDFIYYKYDNLFSENICLAISTRTDVTPDGFVLACKQFKEFEMGNIKNESLYDIWNGINYKRFRYQLSNSFMPVCKECCELFLHSGL